MTKKKGSGEFWKGYRARLEFEMSGPVGDPIIVSGHDEMMNLLGITRETLRVYRCNQRVVTRRAVDLISGAAFSPLIQAVHELVARSQPAYDLEAVIITIKPVSQ